MTQPAALLDGDGVFSDSAVMVAADQVVGVELARAGEEFVQVGFAACDRLLTGQFAHLWQVSTEKLLCFLRGGELQQCTSSQYGSVKEIYLLRLGEQGMQGERNRLN